MAAVERLSPQELAGALRALPGWTLEGGALRRQFACEGFGGAMALAVKAALLAEKADHHPDMLVQYGKVTFTLTTHDAGGVSARDLALARALDAAGGA